MLIRARFRDDSGFTLVEMVAAMAVFALAAGFLLAVLVAGIRTAGFSRDRNVAKELVRERLEEMRRLPYHIQHGDGTECVPKVKLDLLDIYFPNVTDAEYNTADSTYTRTFDPVEGFPNFRLEVVSRFINADIVDAENDESVLGPLETVTPPSTYTCTSSTGDTAPSPILAADVTAFWGPSFEHDFTLRTFLGEAKVGGVELQGSVDANILRIDTAFSDGSTLLARAGIGTANIFVGNSLSSRDETFAVFGRITQPIGTVTQANGARASLAAPPDTGPTTITDSAGASMPHPVLALGFNVLTFGGNQVRDVEVNAGTGLLSALGKLRLRHTLDESLEDPLQVALSATNEVDAGDARGFDTSKRFVSLVKVGGIRPAELDASCIEGGISVTCSATGEMGELRLMPVTYLPVGNATNGYLVTVRLNSLSVSATATRDGTGGSASATFSGVVRYWELDRTPDPDAYVLRTVNFGNGLDNLPDTTAELQAICLRTDLSGNCSVDLEDYILQWSAASSGATEVASGNRSARASLDGVVRITTKATNVLFPNSGFVLRVGDASAQAVDQR
jgi:prepilin-type N-terminal cleavage/methylation domain-containing protein